jgi:hypothetical protein
MRLMEDAHLPFDKLTALSKVEGLRYPHPSSLRGVGPPGRRHCGVLLCTPHYSGFRPAAKPAGWTFSISLREAGSSKVSRGPLIPVVTIAQQGFSIEAQRGILGNLHIALF